MWMKGDEWMWTTGCSWKREKKLVGQSLPVGVGWAWNGAWPVRGMLPNAEELGLLPKASKLAKAPWEGVWPIGERNIKVMYITCILIYIIHTNSKSQGHWMGHLPFHRVLVRGRWQGPGAESQTHMGDRGSQTPPSSLPTTLHRKALVLLSRLSLGRIV